VDLDVLDKSNKRGGIMSIITTHEVTLEGEVDGQSMV
jgi:hypothetical protein